MSKFDIGDKIKDSEFPYIYTVRKIDKQNGRYYIVSNDGFSLWSSCIGYEKVPTLDEILRYGEILTDDKFIEDYFTHRLTRIRTILYENQVFYLKMINDEIVKFKKLTI